MLSEAHKCSVALRILVIEATVAVVPICQAASTLSEEVWPLTVLLGNKAMPMRWSVDLILQNQLVLSSETANCPAAPPQGLPDLLRTVPVPAGSLRHTAILLLLWIIWKSRNRMVFDGVNQGTAAMCATLSEHAGLWVARAPRRLNTEPLEIWCNSLLDVT
ncbi:hypothetical protein GQ55_7G235900 [Panicum hallii var. hallii]|uniref:Uncharacterized protein n=1 Tax=Panicum hallii var. hallii TaxID=1504633 RepID=A0A2T7CYJ3_9POAL|nr:hypothetical protein GQ55_7G235900 [Panicum hallii var. hallii]